MKECLYIWDNFYDNLNYMIILQLGKCYRAKIIIHTIHWFMIALNKHPKRTITSHIAISFSGFYRCHFLYFSRWHTFSSTSIHEWSIAMLLTPLTCVTWNLSITTCIRIKCAFWAHIWNMMYNCLVYIRVNNTSWAIIVCIWFVAKVTEKQEK